MLSSNFYPTVLALSVLLSQGHGQLFSDCIRTCIDNSQYSNCQATDFKCLCRAGRTSGSFLPDVVACMHNSCIDIGVDLLLAPLQFTCGLAGTPLPDSAIDAANSEASSLAAETQTQTITTTATTEFTRVIQTTVTQTVQGSTRVIVFPVTIERTKTVSGQPSTVTKGAAASTASTASNSKSETTSAASNSNSRSSSALSSTHSSMVSSVRSGSASSTSASTSEESTTTTVVTSTSVLGQAVTSTITNTQSAATTTQPGTEANSAPFMNTNAAGKVVVGGSWLGLGVLVVIGAWLL